LTKFSSHARAEKRWQSSHDEAATCRSAALDVADDAEQDIGRPEVSWAGRAKLRDDRLARSAMFGYWP